MRSIYRVMDRNAGLFSSARVQSSASAPPPGQHPSDLAESPDRHRRGGNGFPTTTASAAPSPTAIRSAVSANAVTSGAFVSSTERILAAGSTAIPGSRATRTDWRAVRSRPRGRRPSSGGPGPRVRPPSGRPRAPTWGAARRNRARRRTRSRTPSLLLGQAVAAKVTSPCVVNTCCPSEHRSPGSSCRRCGAR